MSSFQVSGLSSGLDTSALIDGLMFAERASVRRLEASKKRENDALGAWSDIQAKLEKLASAAAAVRTGGALTAAVAASSNESVLRVSAQQGALPGTYAFQVGALAAAQQVSSGPLSGAAALVGAGTAVVSARFASIGASVGAHTLTGGTYTLEVLSVNSGASEATVTFDGVRQTVGIAGDGSFTVTADDGGTLTVAQTGPSTLTTGSASITVVQADATTTLGQFAQALNVAGSPVRAQVIDTGDNTATPNRLVISASSTGVANAADIDLSGLALFSGGLTTLRAAADASITLGDGGLTVTRPSNTIGDLFSGLTIDLVGVTAGEDVEVVVSSDTDRQVDAVKAVIEGMSSVLRQISTYSRFDVEAEKGGPLVGNFTARSVSSELASSMSTVVSSGRFALLSQIGVTFQRDGTFKVDDVALHEALATDPSAVEAVLMGDPAIDDDGIFDTVAGQVEALLGEGGRIRTAKQAAEQTISALEAHIATQEVRLENVEDRYRRQFTALETLIGQLQSQSSYLSSLFGQQRSSS